MKPLIEAAVIDLCPGTSTLLPTKMVIVDLGCSSGPNAIALVSIAVEAIHNHCHQFLQPPPEVSVLLNDLPDNDFNMVVKSGHAPSKQEEYCCDLCRHGVMLRATVH